MNKNKDTFTRSDIETSLRKEFPNLTKLEITEAVDAILHSITEAVALDEKVEIRGCLLYTSPSPRDTEVSRMPSSA